MDKNEIIKIIKDNNIEENSFILAIFDNMVCIGKLENGELCFYEDVNYNLCSQIRIFNEQRELRIYKIDNQIYSKLIPDDEVIDNKNDNYIDEYMFIVGNKIVQKNDKFTVIEQQGKRIALPLILTDDNVKNGVRLVVRNYYKEDSNSQVIISESRLLGFSLKERS